MKSSEKQIFIDAEAQGKTVQMQGKDGIWSGMGGWMYDGGLDRYRILGDAPFIKQDQLPINFTQEELAAIYLLVNSSDTDMKSYLRDQLQLTNESIIHACKEHSYTVWQKLNHKGVGFNKVKACEILLPRTTRNYTILSLESDEYYLEVNKDKQTISHKEIGEVSFDTLRDILDRMRESVCITPKMKSISLAPRSVRIGCSCFSLENMKCLYTFCMNL